jgi:hypothetical protein
MRPEPEDRGAKSVRVWFSRNMDKRAVENNGGISGLSLDLERELAIRRDDYYAYIDGPKHTDKTNLMIGTYDYFCTSGSEKPRPTNCTGSAAARSETCSRLVARRTRFARTLSVGSNF